MISACGKDTILPPETPTKANISGSVNLYDEGVIPVSDSAMIVSIEGTTFVDITDINGSFTLVDVPFGNYTLVYEKAGYGTYKKFAIEHTNTGGTTIISQTPSLGQLSSTTVSNISTNTIGSNVEISITTNPPGSNGNTRYLRYFLSSSSNVDNQNFEFESGGIVSQINPRVITVSQTELNNAGFQSGSTVYVKAYGDSYWSNQYNHPDSGLVFPNLNMTSANAVSFVVP